MQFLVEDLSCNHCAGVITKAILNVDPEAAIQIDIPSRTVQVQTAQSVPAISAVLADAGYPAVLQQG